MKALVLRASFEPKGMQHERGLAPASEMWRNPVLSLEEVREPSIVNPNHIIVQPWICGICGSDLHCSEAGQDGFVTFGGPACLPVILGHEFVGRIVALGGEVRGFEEGDLVTAESIQACWKCIECAEGHLNECKDLNLVGLTVNGAFAPYVSVDARHCLLINRLLENLDFESACEVGTMLEPLGVAYKGLFMKGRFTQGESVAIIGLGPIGLMCAALGLHAGASTVIGFDLRNERVELARRLGVKAFNAKKLMDEHVLPQEIVHDLTDGRGAALSVEAAGTVTAFGTALSVVALRGRLLVLGRMPEPVHMNLNDLMSRSVEVLPSRGHAGYGILPKLITLLAEGAIDVRGIITNRFEFRSILEAFDRARTGVDGKILVKLNGAA